MGYLLVREGAVGLLECVCVVLLDGAGFVGRVILGGDVEVAESVRLLGGARLLGKRKWEGIWESWMGYGLCSRYGYIHTLLLVRTELIHAVG